MNNIRATLCQLTPKLGDKEYNLQLIKESIESASKEGSHIIVFPELFLTGYSIGPKIHELAESRNGKSLKRIGALCKEHSIHAVVGLAEKGDDGKYYISSALINDEGEVVAIYQKTHLFELEKEVFTAGNTLKVVDTTLGKIGLMICFEVEFPEIARVLKLQGADLFIIINANMEPYGEYHYIYAKSRAMENEIPLIICNRLGSENDLVFCGDSMVIDKTGKELVHLYKREAVRTVTIPNKAIKNSLNYGINRRSDLYTILTEGNNNH